MTTSTFQINDIVVNIIDNRIGKIYSIHQDAFLNDFYKVIYNDNTTQFVDKDYIKLYQTPNTLQ